MPAPVWSPEGTKIACAGNTDTSKSLEIYTMNADGSNSARLTNGNLSYIKRKKF